MCQASPSGGGLRKPPGWLLVRPPLPRPFGILGRPAAGTGLPRATCHLLRHPSNSCFKLRRGRPGPRSMLSAHFSTRRPAQRRLQEGARRRGWQRREAARQDPWLSRLPRIARCSRRHEARATRTPARDPSPAAPPPRPTRTPAAAHSPPHSAEYWSPQSPDCGLQPPPPAGASCCCRCCSSCLSRESGE